MNYQALIRESTKEANDSLEIMCWYKEIADKHNKDFAPQKANQRQAVNIVGGEDVTYGRLNDNLLTAFGWSRTHSIKED